MTEINKTITRITASIAIIIDKSLALLLTDEPLDFLCSASFFLPSLLRTDEASAEKPLLAFSEAGRDERSDAPAAASFLCFSAARAACLLAIPANAEVR